MRGQNILKQDSSPDADKDISLEHNDLENLQEQHEPQLRQEKVHYLVATLWKRKRRQVKHTHVFFLTL